MRTVLKNHSEVAHFWANEVQNEGRSNNMFFHNKTIYSYGHHFPIARHIKEGIILFTRKGYSVSTSKHISYTKQAIPGHYLVILADEIDLDNKWNVNKKHNKNIITMLNDMKSNLDKSTRARVNKNYYLSEVSKTADNMKNYLDLFKCKSKLPYKTKKLVNEIISGNNYCLIELANLEKIERKRQLEQLKKKALKDLIKWRNGEIYNLPMGLNRNYLRLINGGIETSGHIKINTDVFLEYYKRLKCGINLEGQKISHYTINKQTDKLITIGCHKIEVKEIDKMGALLLSNSLKERK